MKQVEVIYEVHRNEELLIAEQAIVNLTDKNIKEITQYILESPEHQTGELVDIPSHIYDRIFNQVRDDAVNKLKAEKEVLYTDDMIYLVQYLPETLLNLLPDEVINVLPEEMFEVEESDDMEGDDEGEEEFTVTFALRVEDLFQIKGRGVVLDGIVEFGKCKVGDNGLVLDEDGNVITEATITNIEHERKLLTNLDEFEETEGMRVGLLTPFESKKEVKGAVAFIIEAE